MEHELQEASEKYLEAEKLNEVFQKELVVMPDLKERVIISLKLCTLLSIITFERNYFFSRLLIHVFMNSLQI